MAHDLAPGLGEGQQSGWGCHSSGRGRCPSGAARLDTLDAGHAGPSSRLGMSAFDQLQAFSCGPGVLRCWTATSRLERILRTALAMVCILTLSMTGARAADVRTFKEGDGRPGIAITGELLRGDDERFATVAGTVADDATVWLDSPGGSLLAGLHIGTAIRLKGWRTAVPDDATCASACGLMWLGGIQRSVGRQARVGFHAAYVTTEGRKQEVGSGERAGRLLPEPAGAGRCSRRLSHGRSAGRGPPGSRTRWPGSSASGPSSAFPRCSIGSPSRGRGRWLPPRTPLLPRHPFPARPRQAT